MNIIVTLDGALFTLARGLVRFLTFLGLTVEQIVLGHVVGAFLLPLPLSVWAGAEQPILFLAFSGTFFLGVMYIFAIIPLMRELRKLEGVLPHSLSEASSIRMAPYYLSTIVGVCVMTSFERGWLPLYGYFLAIFNFVFNFYLLLNYHNGSKTRLRNIIGAKLRQIARLRRPISQPTPV